MGQFSGKKALVIGGSGGIGKELSRLLVVSGASVIIHGGHETPDFIRFIEDLQRIADVMDTHISVGKTTVFFENSDFSKECHALDTFLAQADILCVCFGPFLQKSLDTTTLEDWQRISLLNYALPGYCVSSALRYMTERKWGRILLFGGTRTYSVNAFKTNAAYAGAKTAVCSLVRSVAGSYAIHGITCNALVPGFVETEYQGIDEKKKLADRFPGGSLITAAAVAKYGMFLLESQDLNGVLLNADRGWNP